MKRWAAELARGRFSGLRAGLRAAAAGAGRTASRVASACFRLLWPAGQRHAAALFALGIAGLGLYGMSFYSRLPERLPAKLDWRSAAAVLARDARPGDAVALAPWWAERAREVLPAWLPVMAFPRLAGEDLVGARRIWLLASPRAPGYRFDLEDDLVARAAAVEGPRRLGELELTRFDLRAPILPLAFLPDRLATATVSVGERACARDGRDVFRCPTAPFVVVAREVREVGSLPRPCLYAHPSPDPGAPLTIVFPGVPLGRALRGHTGIAGEEALGGAAPVRLSVKVDGQDVGSAEEPPGRPGWHPFQIETERQAGRAGTVTFTVSSPDVRSRHFCFDAFSLR